MAWIKMAVFAYFVFISCILLIDATEVAEVVAGVFTYSVCSCWIININILRFIFVESRAVFDPNWQINGSFVWADGCGFPGNDINANGLPKRKKEECGTSCLNNPQCDRFSWNTAGNCYHKKWSATVAAARTGFRCGFILARSWNVDGNNLWASNCDFYGQDLPNRQYTMNNIQECSKKCSDVPECDHFTWSNVNNRCSLKKGKWADDKPNPLVNAQCGYIPSRIDRKSVV